MLKCVPTGYLGMDILLGQNIRDGQGNLIEVQRGFTIGKQYDFSAFPGAGKSTVVGDFAGFGYHCGYPIYKTLIIDADNAAWDVNRLVKITKLPRDVVEDNFEIIDCTTVEGITDKLNKMDADYKKEKLKPVDVINAYTGEKEKMMPFVYVIVDTVTSLNSEANDVGGKGDTLANESFLNAFRKLSSLIGTITNYFEGNVIVIWTSHLKKNKPELGARVAAKEFKSSPNSWKSHLPERLRQKATGIYFMQAEDSANLESSEHPIVKYGLQDLAEGGNAYAVNLMAVKSRSGIEGRTKLKFMFINGCFDRTMTTLASAVSLGIFRETTEQYPSAATPHVFKNCPEENKIMGNKRKKALYIDGYDRPTNIIEARLLLNYTGDDEEVLELRNKLQLALIQGYEDKLFYELEVNNVSSEELATNKQKLNALLGMLSQVRRTKTLDTTKKIELPPEQTLEDDEDFDDEE